MKGHLITNWRVLKAGLQNCIRNITLAVAAMAVIAITLTTVLLLLIANVTLNGTIKQINSKISIQVYLNDSVTTAQKNSLITGLQGLSEVQSVAYLSKSEVLAIYEAQNEDNTSIRSAINETNNPLPATVNISPKSSNKLSQIKNYLDQPSVLALQSDPSSYSGTLKNAINKIGKTTQLLREGGVISILVFAAVSVLIIFNTIRMTIFNRRDELQIMRLLGASTWYIRGPFVVENIIYGLLSAAISLAFVDVMLTTVSNSLQASSFGLLDITYAHTYFRQHLWFILLIQLGLGILIGAVSSVIATRRYLKFKTSK
jgi:cell division transport system permease protein